MVPAHLGYLVVGSGCRAGTGTLPTCLLLSSPERISLCLLCSFNSLVRLAGYFLSKKWQVFVIKSIVQL